MMHFGMPEQCQSSRTASAHPGARGQGLALHPGRAGFLTALRLLLDLRLLLSLRRDHMLFQKTLLLLVRTTSCLVNWQHSWQLASSHVHDQCCRHQRMSNQKNPDLTPVRVRHRQANSQMNGLTSSALGIWLCCAVPGAQMLL